MVQDLIFATTPTSLAETVHDVAGVDRTASITTATPATAPWIAAGTSTNTPAFANYQMADTTNPTWKTPATSYGNAATVTALASNLFTLTATITNGSGSNITYKEIGLAVTVATYQFLLAHDQVNGGTGYTVSPTGQLQVTYTATFS